MDFHQAFFDELEKLSAMKNYPDPRDSKKDTAHWKKRRIAATALGAAYPMLSAFAARKGRKLRTWGASLLGKMVGYGAGRALGRSLGKGNKAVAAKTGGSVGSISGSALGAYLGHGKYDKKVSERQMRIHRAKNS